MEIIIVLWLILVAILYYISKGLVLLKKEVEDIKYYQKIILEQLSKDKKVG